MASDLINRQVLLKNRPLGVAQKDDFIIVDGAVIEPAEGEILVRNLFLSFEPAMRGWIADTAGYTSPVALGAVMRALAAGEIIASRNADWPVGAFVTGCWDGRNTPPYRPAH